MKFTVLTLFPDMVEHALRTSILGKAIDKNLIELRTVNIRDYTVEKHGRVDDYTYGGGAGMLMKAQPVYDAWLAATDGQTQCRTVYVTPQGRTFTQNMAADLAREEELVILCGHYEGIDARVLDKIVTDYVSIGDYVLTGGELPAMVMIDAIARLVPGVLHNDASAETESFHRDLLEYPQYSRPEVWNGIAVPEVLLTGDHRRVENWRLEQSIRLTRERRPDLYCRYEKKETLIKRLSSNKRHNIHLMESLRCGRAEVLYQSGKNLLLYDADADVYMICGGEEKGRRELTEFMAAERRAGTLCVVASQSCWQPLLEERFGELTAQECIQACYTQRNSLPVRHKDIRTLDETTLDFVEMHYRMNTREYLAGRIAAGAVYGIYADGALAGFMETQTEGSAGMLYIAEQYRHRGLASSLEAYVINRRLEQGFTPYLWIPAEQDAALQLQEKLGLYLSKESLWILTEK